MFIAPILCFAFASLVTLVDAFGVFVPVQQKRASRAVRPSFFVPSTKPDHHGRMVLWAESSSSSSDEEEDEGVALIIIVEDDEWLRLAMQLTDAVFAEVKSLVAATLAEEDIQKLQEAGKAIEARVRAEVADLRKALPPKDDIERLAAELVDEIESKVREVTGKQDYKLGDATKDAQARLVKVAEEFADGKTTVDAIQAEIDKRVEKRVQEAKDTAGYEYWKFKKEVEKQQDELLEQVLEPDDYKELKELAEKADELAASATSVVSELFNKLKET